MKCLITILLLFFQAAISLAQTTPLPDPAFLKYLKDYFPHTVDANNQLIISEASNVTGALSCENCGIKNIEGIQYFTEIHTIYMRGNNISSIPDISALTNLEVLNLSENNLTTLPSLNELGKLTKLLVYSNQLQSIPRLATNSLLTHIVVYDNQLGSIPDLSGLENLQFLEVGGNEISSIPDLTLCSNLEQLLVWENKLRALPDLSKNTKLKVLNAGGNNLSLSPDLSNNTALEEVILDKNQLTESPELSNHPNLKHVILEDNALSFEDLLKYTHYPDYNSVFSVTNQRPIEAGEIQKVHEGSSYTFSSKTDTSLQNTTYTWFFETNQIAQITKDSFSKKFINNKDQGYYYCKINHPAFPDLTLQTDSFYIEVIPCLDISSLRIEKNEINCLQPGSVKISLPSQTSRDIVFKLEGVLSGIELKSEVGNFQMLKESEYLLIIETENCSKTYPSIITIPNKDCKETFLTPDEDGQNDAIYFEQYGEVKIYDKSGTVVRTLKIPSEWKGTNQNGVILSPGYYIAEINNGEAFVNISIIY